jgi:saposin
MRVLLVFCLVLCPFVYGVNEECSWGESYWCSELSIAKKCGAIDHCKTTVWSNQLPQDDPTEVCEFCQNIVADVHKFISSKKTEAQIGRFLASACAIVPNLKAANECKTLVEEYVPEIIDLIVAEMKPRTVCSLMHLCKNSFADKVRHSEISTDSPPRLIHIPLHKDMSGVVGVSKSKICRDCSAFIQDIIDQLTDPKYQQEIENEIDVYICDNLPSYMAKECRNLVDEFLPLAFVFLKQHLNATEECESLGFCISRQVTSDLRQSISDIIAQVMSSSDKCSMCKTAVGEIRMLIRSETVQTDIKNFIKNDICDNISTMKDACNKMVDEYAQAAFEFLATQLDPDTRCRSLGFCQSVEDSILRFQPAPRLPVATPAVKTSVECVLCEYVMSEVEKILQNNKTEEAIIKALDAVCDILPKTIRASCEDFVNTYTPAIIIILQSEVTPGEICTMLGLCKNASFHSKASTSDDTCIVCETLIQYVEALVDTNATVQEVEDIIKKICNFLPDTMKTQCDTIIDKYGNDIVRYILGKYSPKQICTFLKLCTEREHTTTIPRLLGSNKCTYGPAYWCASPENADKCGATSHCKKYVWKD